jgi:hypothetical protein
MGNKIDREVRNQWETELIVRFVMGNIIDREVRNQWERELIARFVTNGKQKRA